MRLYGKADMPRVVDPIAIITHNEASNMFEHYHDFYEVEYIRSGQGYHVINGDRHRVHPGDVFFTNIGSYHYYETSKQNPIMVYNCVVEPVALESITASFNACSRGGKLRVLPACLDIPYAYMHDSDGEIHHILDTMNYEYLNKAIDYQTALLGHTFVLFSTLGHIYQGQLSARHNHHALYISNVKRYIKTNFRHSISVQDLANMVHLHPDYLERTFKEATGVSITAYIQNIRIACAAELFDTSDMRISDIVHEVGYQDERSFRRLFKERMGQSPQQYRQEARARRLRTNAELED